MSDETQPNYKIQLEQTFKKLKESEQKVGVLTYKLNLRKKDKEQYDTVNSKKQRLMDAYKDDLKLAYENLEKISADNTALRRVYKLLSVEGKDKENLEVALAK